MKSHIQLANVVVVQMELLVLADPIFDCASRAIRGELASNRDVVHSRLAHTVLIVPKDEPTLGRVP